MIPPVEPCGASFSSIWQVGIAALRLPVRKASHWTVARRQDSRGPQVFPPPRDDETNMARIAHLLPTRWSQAPPRLGLAWLHTWSAVTAS
jgi:hypothetical protein